MRKYWKRSWLFSASIVAAAVSPEMRVCKAQFLSQPQFAQSQSGQSPSGQPQSAQPQFGQIPMRQPPVLQPPVLQPPVLQHPTLQSPALPATQRKVSWTQKLTSVFTGSPKKQSNSQMSQSERPRGAVELESGVASVEFCLSVAKQSEQSGNISHARGLYQQALTMQPENLEGMLALARLEDREGQLDAALHYYLQAVKSNPQSPKTLNDLSLCFARRGQLAEALKPLQDAIRLQPTKALYRNNIAKVLTERNQINEALQHLAAVHPPAVAQYNMGVLLHQRGRNSEAVQFLTAAMHMDPSFTAASTLLAQLPSQSPTGYAQRGPASNDHILPTPIPMVAGQPYPSTGIFSANPRFQAVPAETAQIPVGASPVLLPPVR